MTECYIHEVNERSKLLITKQEAHKLNSKLVIFIGLIILSCIAILFGVISIIKHNKQKATQQRINDVSVNNTDVYNSDTVSEDETLEKDLYESEESFTIDVIEVPEVSKDESSQNIVVSSEQISSIYDNTNKYPEACLIWETIKSWGWSDNVATGIIGNMMAEAGGGTLGGLKNWDIESKSGYGLIQWGGGRLNDIKSIYGSKPTIMQQLEFMKNELTGNNGVRQQVKPQQLYNLLNAESPEKAAEMFARYYERCHINYVNKRLPYARKAYNYFVNSQYTD